MPEISKMLASVCSMLRCIRAPKQMLGSIEPVYLRTISWNRGFCAVSTGVSLDVRSTFSIVSSATESRQTDFIFGYEDISELHTHSIGEDVKKLFDLKFANQREVNKVALHQMMTRLQKEPSDTGSTDVQVGVLTVRIRYLTEHMKVHRKDFSCKRKLLMMVDKRKKLLKYLKRTNLERYHEILKDLGIRPIVETKFPK